jgi:hypothetical protein
MLAVQQPSPAKERIGSAGRLGGRAPSDWGGRAARTRRPPSIETFITTYIGPAPTA